MGIAIRVIKGDTRKLDGSSHVGQVFPEQLEEVPASQLRSGGCYG